MMGQQKSEYHLPRHFLNTDITIAAINESRISPPNGDANFDSNMVIILAVLLCALICALGLNSVVRCALRCSRRLVFETTAEGVSLRLDSSGLPKDALRRIPVVVYKSGIDIPATDCPICLGEFTEGEKVRILPRCNHGFHVKCIDAWLVSHSSCPNCRQILFGNPANAASS
ncbi:OLC1v1006446C1 [Oldenlandia corymbosa var. corymbosa]|uniref:RING-type E3 ubiquitin transferase n=1 Tax=Oldenlandia corymbosa var. corymbosa TaxID=529605 RepID=A0AAV1DJ64_OLDCO|nr:OLC1v1006446C1 [Oldenlandia corymbosa var. corymbosa]